ncbi:MAG TPA: helix-turn-helix domain-containing protein, partial [Burkholderiaceae bacterium]|nr:helix-turn-helix domain-containing protein [Burkholderiaceae bacterium]
MTDDASATSEARNAGAMLRAARERQGLHIAALAAAIKVPQAKLEALEAGRYDELTDATFVRALAQSVCRVLKIEAKPVLDLMPSARTSALDRVAPVRRTPFHDKPGREEPSEPRVWHQPMFWIVAVLLVAAGAFVLWPQHTEGLTAWLAKLPRLGSGDAPKKPAAPAPVVTAPTAPVVQAPTASPATAASLPDPAAPAPTQTAPSSTPVVTETVHSAPAPTVAA